jgi:hypothetical protein
MDLKETQLFNEVYLKLAGKTFSEIDIYSLYILLRDRLKSEQMPFKRLIELGDLVAHRKRDQGILLKKFSTVHKYLYSNEYDKESYIKSMEEMPAFNLDGFKSEINTLLEQYEKPTLDDSIIMEIMLYSFSLMQSSTYKKGSVNGHLFTFFTHDYVALMADLGDNSPFYCFAKLDICISTRDVEWWKNNWFSVFNILRKNPFLIKRDRFNKPLIYLNDNVL